jgi:uncharacterized protein YegP (UPF0339 family)
MRRFIGNPVCGTKIEPCVPEPRSDRASSCPAAGPSESCAHLAAAANGETIAQSESYSTKAAAKNGIASVKRNAGKATTQDDTGE